MNRNLCSDKEIADLRWDGTKVKAIMYHYVREFSDSLPNFRFLDVVNFRKQLSFFAEEYGFVERDEWLEFVCNGTMPKKQGKVVLTFDDAMSCHYDFVFPELLERGLWGIFYVPTAPYRTNTMLDVHKIHCLCGAFNGGDLLAAASECLSPEMMPDSKKHEYKTMTYRSQKNYDGVTDFKRLLNYFIDYKHREKVIYEIARVLNYSFQGSDFYVAKQSLIEMRDKGMIIGSHTDSHPVMSKLSYAQQLEELKLSFSVLDNIITNSVKTYCHPYGRQHDFNSATLAALDTLDVAYSFMVEPREITPQDRLTSKHYLPRFDCNNFKYGEAS